MASSLSNYIFELKSNPQGLNIDKNTNPRFFKRIYFKDSIFKFYPYAEFYFKDNTGIIPEQFFFVEGMQLKTKIGQDEFKDENGIKVAGYLENNYAWSEYQLQEFNTSTFLNGTSMFLAISYHYMLDSIKPRAFKKTISDIAKQIAQEDFGISDSKKLFISKTTNSASLIWYQGNRLNREFLENTLATNAYSNLNNSNQSSFATFINTRGEFYFMSYYEMFSQNPIATYKLKFTKENTIDYFNINSIEVLHGGLPVNKKNYQQTIYSLNEDGSINTISSTLKDHYIKVTGKDRFLLRKNYVQTNKIIDFKLKENEDTENFLGRENILYQDSNLSYRVLITIQFNPRAVAGKTININIEKSTNNNQLSSEFSGNWLIVSSEHLMDFDMAPYTKLILAKSSIAINKDWPYIKDLV